MATLVKFIFFLVSLIPVRVVGAIGAGLGRLFYLLDARHRNIALRNLDRIYPDQDEAWKIRIAHESFAELGRTIFELPHVYLRSESFLRSRLKVEGEDDFRQTMEQGNGIILTAMHHSNWELGGLAVSMLGHKTDTIYRPVRLNALDIFVRQARERFGATFHSRNIGLRWLPRALKDGHCIAVMIDQHLSNGTSVPFLGHQAFTTTLPAVFTAKYNTPVYGVRLDRIGRSFQFRLQFWPIDIHNNEDQNSPDEVAIMEDICNAFAPCIHDRPELWLWLHRRWLWLDIQEGIES